MTLVFDDLPDDRLGEVDYARQTITLDRQLLQGERRATLTHELIHLERGPAVPGTEAREEQIVSREAALRLITMAELVQAVQWTDDVHELAFELWVDPDTVEVRLRHLPEAERLLLAQVRALRDGY